MARKYIANLYENGKVGVGEMDRGLQILRHLCLITSAGSEFTLAFWDDFNCPRSLLFEGHTCDSGLVRYQTKGLLLAPRIEKLFWGVLFAGLQNNPTDRKHGNVTKINVSQG